MKKISIELTKINSQMKLKFGMIAVSDDEIKYPNNKLISRFSINGNEYLRINPRPFIVIDISDAMKKEGWSTNYSITLNKYYLFRTLQALKSLLTNFKNEGLFYYQDGVLTVDNVMSEKISVTIHTTGKAMKFVPSVVPDEENPELFYEGCIFFINTMDNYCYLTYTELGYLYYELSKVDLTQLSLHATELMYACKNEQVQQIKRDPIPEVRVEELKTPSTITVVKKGEIPRI